MLRPPKDRFIASAHAAEWKRILATVAFEEATLAALTALQAEMPKHPNLNAAAEHQNQMLGAQRYLEILCTIAVPEPQPKSREETGLNYEAGV